MRHVILLLLFPLMLPISTATAGDVKFTNSTSKTLYIAVAYWDKLWISKGWYVLTPGSTKTLIPNNNNRYVYWYADTKEDDTNYTGQHSFCTDTDAFTKYFSDKSCVPEYTKGFSQIDVGNYDVFTFTILHESKCNGDCTEGYGTYYYSSGDKYVGNWQNDQQSGTGTHYFKNGDKYVGNWQNGQKSGTGTYYYNNGDKYVGSWQNDQKSGTGTYYFSNGDKYAGDWRSGLMHGNGVYSYASGTQKKGVWENDVWKYHGTMYVILVMNTDNLNVGTNAKNIKQHFYDFYKQVAEKGQFAFKPRTITGSNFNKEYITKFVEGFKCSKYDVIVFHYFGHGGRLSSTVGRWPLLKLTNYGALEDYGLSLEYFKEKLYNNTPSRLGLFFADCCNFASGNLDGCPKSSGSILTPGGISRPGVENCFLNQSGYLMASSSSPGEASHCWGDQSSFYTTSFIEAMTRQLQSSDASWTKILQTVREGVLALTSDCSQTSVQTPQHLLSLRSNSPD